eukprot:TRINITY_DN9818_c0_g1_i6.p1 TRINITY_DN9818_c0_g1~~TRINITY_DN9818_c0_g1_i6.p1  ORF type:complete len:615 (-),score=31.26 TRINITY_DN9818_c0_g1_i6:82-1926(-)
MLARCRCHRAESLPNDEKDSQLPRGCRYPFYVTHVSDFIDLRGTPLPHQEMLRLSLVTPWQKGKVGKSKQRMFTSFVSHQWVGNGAPDPRGRQLDALRRLLLHGFHICDGMFSALHGISSVSEKERKQVLAGWLWYDFYGVPQLDVNNFRRSTSDFLAAVQSIPRYVELSDVFIALTPVMTHESGANLNHASWQSRGWCAAELSFWALRLPFGKQKVVRVHSSTKATCEAANHWMESPVYTANFSVPSDRDVISELLRELIRERAAILLNKAFQERSAEDMLAAGLLCRLEHFMCGPPLPPGVGSSRCSSARKLVYSEWLERVDWPKLQKLGWTPAHFHAFSGDVEALRECIERLGNMMLRTKTKHASFFLSSFVGATPLGAAAFSSLGNPVDCVKIMLEQRAEVDMVARFAPAYSRPYAGQEVLIQKLLATQGDLDKRYPLTGTAPLGATALGNGVVANALIDQRADANARNWFGTTCLQDAASRMNNRDSTDVVLALLRARADVNATCGRPSTTLAKLFSTACHARYLAGCRSELVQAVELLNRGGGTALHYAAFAGNWRVCSVLLSHGASREALTRDGHTPEGIARLFGYDEQFQKMLGQTARLETKFYSL